MLLRRVLLAALFLPGAAAAQTVEVVPPGAWKVCQLTGDWDPHQQLPTVNQTGSDGIRGIDLGSAFEHYDPFSGESRTWFLFGDAHAAYGSGLGARDAIGYTSDVDPTWDPDLPVGPGNDCVRIDFLLDPAGQYFEPFQVQGWAPYEHAAFRVPTGGVSLPGPFLAPPVEDGIADGDGPPGEIIAGQDRIFAYASRGVVIVHGVPDRTNEYTTLVSSGDGGFTWREEYVFSDDSFISAFPVRDAGNSGPVATDTVWIFGSGDFRASPVRLARVERSKMRLEQAVTYFDGLDASGDPQWSSDEADADPITPDACVGNLTVRYFPEIDRWLMAYNCSQYNGDTVLLSAPEPWGPWTQATARLFDQSTAYCEFIQTPSCPLPSGANDDDGKWGGAYAPTFLPEYTEVLSPTRLRIYFIESTWRPYQVVLMSAEIEVTP